MSYYDNIASGYNELHGEEQLRKYTIIRQHLQLPPYARVLDVGAGTGIGNQIIPSVGIDPAAKLIEQHPNKESRVGDAEQLPYPDKSFDAAISVTALHHTDYRKALAEMRRVSRGQLAISLLRKSSTTKEIASYFEQKYGPCIRVEEEKDVILISEI
jgi:ubiquinone/menaquinone biosynthesis C-methylase UbiE